MIVTLLTDFGSADHYVAALKGAILARQPDVSVVDITHEVPPFGISTAAFLLSVAAPAFPPGVVHVVVVDPGVGSARAPLAARGRRGIYVGPDNGVLSYAIEREEWIEVRRIDNSALKAAAVSSTFHGRDIFAPAAAELAGGFAFEEVGPPVRDIVRLPDRTPAIRGDGRMLGFVQHIDHYGNCITTFTPDHLCWPSKVRFEVNGRTIEEVSEHFAGGPPSEPFVMLGSTGYLEIALREGSAAARLGVQPGAPVTATAGG